MITDNFFIWFPDKTMVFRWYKNIRQKSWVKKSKGDWLKKNLPNKTFRSFVDSLWLSGVMLLTEKKNTQLRYCNQKFQSKQLEKKVFWKLNLDQLIKFSVIASFCPEGFHLLCVFFVFYFSIQLKVIVPFFSLAAAMLTCGLFSGNIQALVAVERYYSTQMLVVASKTIINY